MMLNATSGIRAPTAVTPAVGWMVSGPKSGRHIGSFIFSAMGVTTCEAKSGYGLDPEDEYKQLRAIRRLNETQKVELIPTFLGAHALPEEFKNDREGFLRLLCEEMIPTVAREHLAEFCDVFCETGVFTAQESRRILEAGKKYGLTPKIHADEIDPIGGSQLAGEIGAITAEHLIVCPEEGIASMSA